MNNNKYKERRSEALQRYVDYFLKMVDEDNVQLQDVDNIRLALQRLANGTVNHASKNNSQEVKNKDDK